MGGGEYSRVHMTKGDECYDQGTRCQAIMSVWGTGSGWTIWSCGSLGAVLPHIARSPGLTRGRACGLSTLHCTTQFTLVDLLKHVEGQDNVEELCKTMGDVGIIYWSSHQRKCGHWVKHCWKNYRHEMWHYQRKVKERTMWR